MYGAIWHMFHFLKGFWGILIDFGFFPNTLFSERGIVYLNESLHLNSFSACALHVNKQLITIELVLPETSQCN